MPARVVVDLTPSSSGSRFRGIGVYAFELARALIAIPSDPEIELTFLVGRGSTMRVVDAGAAFLHLDAGVPHKALAYQFAKRTFGRAALVRARAELYHATDPMGTPRFFVRRSIVTCHDLIPAIFASSYLGMQPRWLRLARDRGRFASPDRVIAISHAAAADASLLLRLGRDRFSVVHHGVDARRFSPRTELGERQRVARALGTDRPYFLYVGAFDARKRVPMLIEAFSRIARGVDQALAIVGRLEPPRVAARLDALVAKHELGSRVRFVGFASRDILPALYRSATAHVQPSAYEGFGMTVLEAIACGCPVVAAARSAVPEIAGDAAWYFAPDDAEGLAMAMDGVARNARKAAELAHIGIARAAHFTWERAAMRTRDVYRAVLAEP